MSLVECVQWHAQGHSGFPISTSSSPALWLRRYRANTSNALSQSVGESHTTPYVASSCCTPSCSRHHQLFILEQRVEPPYRRGMPAQQIDEHVATRAGSQLDASALLGLLPEAALRDRAVAEVITVLPQTDQP